MPITVNGIFANSIEAAKIGDYAKVVVTDQASPSLNEAEFLKIVGSAIRRARDQRGMRAKELALRLKIDASTVSDYENGKTSVSFMRAAEIARAIGVSIADFNPLETRPGHSEAVPSEADPALISEVSAQNDARRFVRSIGDDDLAALVHSELPTATLRLAAVQERLDREIAERTKTDLALAHLAERIATLESSRRVSAPRRQ